MEFTLDNMCRTCLNEDGLMYSVFSKENQIQRNQSYADMLMACASVQVDAEDGLPKFICEQCMKQLIVAFYFKEQSEQSYATLREITKNPSIEFIKEEAPEAYTDITNVIQVDLNCTNVQKQHQQQQPHIKQITLVKGEENDQSENSEEFKLSKEFLSDDVVLDYDMVNDIDEECTETITGDIGDNMDDIFQVKPAKSVTKRDYPQFKRIKLPGRTTNTNTNSSNNNNNKRDTTVLVCPYCEHKFKDKQEFRRHKRTHILSYRCELCDKQFRSAHGLNYHTKIHQGIKNFVCPYEECSRRFTLKQALDKHLSVHTQEKNHLCSLCGKAYGTYDALHYHIRTHKGERPYLCMHCGKTFKQSCHLKSHMWVHNGIKPHVCTMCGKCYTSGHQLKKHMNKYCNNTSSSSTSSSAGAGGDNKNNTNQRNINSGSSSNSNIDIIHTTITTTNQENIINRTKQPTTTTTTITVTDELLAAVIGH